MKEKLWIFGAGGHAKVIADIALATGKFEVMGFIDQMPSEKTLFDKPLLAEDQFHWPEKDIYFVAVGFNFLRKKIVEKSAAKIPPIKWATLIHPSAVIGKDVIIKEGTAVMAGAIINSAALIGSHCVVNTGAIVEHDCRLESGSSLAPGSVIGGNVIVGVNSYLGIGCTVLHGKKIGEDAVVAAGAVVTKDVVACSVVAGVPAKWMRTREVSENYLI